MNNTTLDFYLNRLRRQFGGSHNLRFQNCLASLPLSLLQFQSSNTNIATYKFIPKDSTDHLLIILDQLDPFYRLGIAWESTIAHLNSKHRYRVMLCDLNLGNLITAEMFVNRIVRRLWDLQSDVKQREYYSYWQQGRWRSIASLEAASWVERVKGVDWYRLFCLMSDLFDVDHDLRVVFHSQFPEVV